MEERESARWLESEEVPSPDGKHVLLFEGGSEIRNGLFVYFQAVVDGQPIPGYAFSGRRTWSSSSHYLALSAWMSEDIAGSALTVLFLLDLKRRVLCEPAKCHGGEISPLRFQGEGEGELIFIRSKSGVHTEHSFPLEAISDWRPWGRPWESKED